MTEFDLFTLFIDKVQIEKKDFSIIKEYIENNWDVGYNQLNISFSDFDNDPREIFEIPEIREWVITSIHEEKIPWFFFLSKDITSSSIKALALCYCAEPVKQEDGEIRFLPLQNKMYQFITLNKRRMVEFIKEYKFNESFNQEALFLIDKYFENWLGGNNKK
jgi:hypothetical protein